MTKSRSVVFVGPTYAPVAASRLIERVGFEWLPPAERGDIDRIASGPAGIIVLVDGKFGQSLAVGHAELRRALTRGWTVCGLSSMGAIRAFEMRAFGMKGFGRVYEHFLIADDFPDDEVAQLHEGGPPYTPHSEPLVHLRYCLSAMETDGDISAEAAQAIVDELRRMWFAKRTLDAFIGLVRTRAGVASAAAATRHARNFSLFRAKSQDLIAFFQESQWTDGSYIASPVPAPYWRPASEQDVQASHARRDV
ncbi:MAG: TfuA-like protein [Gemmatimonadaceae bacterium]